MAAEYYHLPNGVRALELAVVRFAPYLANLDYGDAATELDKAMARAAAIAARRIARRERQQGGGPICIAPAPVHLASPCAARRAARAPPVRPHRRTRAPF